MGTNFYLATASQEQVWDDDPTIHVGKRSLVALDWPARPAPTFFWAMRASDYARLPANTVIEDEYGKTYTLPEFRDILAACHHNTDQYGERFS